MSRPLSILHYDTSYFALQPSIEEDDWSPYGNCAAGRVERPPTSLPQGRDRNRVLDRLVESSIISSLAVRGLHDLMWSAEDLTHRILSRRCNGKRVQRIAAPCRQISRYLLLAFWRNEG
jgi:hypothetical protein